MSNRKDRRRAAAVRKHAGPMSRTDRRQLWTRVAVVIGAAIAAVVLLMLTMPRGI
jgi:type VI protein secretion system component VasF